VRFLIITGLGMLEILVGIAIATSVLAISPNASAVRQGEVEATPPLHSEPPTGENQIHKDSNGDPLPPGAIARLGTTRFRIGSPIAEVKLSPNGKMLAATTIYNKIYLLDAESGRELRHFEACGHDAVFSPDSRQLLIIDGHSDLELWDAFTGKLLRRLKTPRSSGFSASFSADGNILASGPYETEADPLVYVWNVATGKPRARLRVVNNYLVRVALSADGSTLASWGTTKGAQGDKSGEPTRMIQVWDVSTAKEIRRLAFDSGHVHRAALSKSGRILAAINFLDMPKKGEPKQSATLQFWDVSSGKELRRFSVPRDLEFVAFSYSPGDKLLAVTTDEKGKVTLWDDSTGKLLGPFLQPKHYFLRTLLFREDGGVLAYGLENQWTIRLWDVRSGTILSGGLGGHASPVHGLAFAPDDKTLVTASQDGQVFRWDINSASKVSTIRNMGSNGSCTLSPNGKYLACEMAFGGTYLWDLASGRAILDPRSVPSLIGNGMRFSGDGRVLAAHARQNEILLFETKTGKTLRSLACQEGVLGDPALSSDGTKLAVHNKIEGPAPGQSRFRVLLCDSITSKALIPLTEDKRFVIQPVFSPDDRLLAMAGDADDGIMIWDLLTRKQIHRIALEPYGSRCMIFSPDGKTLAITSHDNSGKERVIQLFERYTGQVRRRFAGHQGTLLCLAFSQDGKLLASGGWDTSILLWDVTGLRRDGGLPLRHLLPDELEALWRDLRSDDAARAYDALWKMVASPDEAIAFLRTRVRARTPVNATQVAQRIAELDSDPFATRDKASEELKTLAESAEPAARKALQSKPSGETARRLEQFLESLNPAQNPDMLRDLRAIEVLEHIGTSRARDSLATFSNGVSNARLTQEAKAALARLAKRGNSVRE